MVLPTPRTKQDGDQITVHEKPLTAVRFLTVCVAGW